MAETCLAIGAWAVLVGVAVVLARHALGALYVAGGESGGWWFAGLFTVFLCVAGASGWVLDALAFGADVADEASEMGEMWDVKEGE